jgi:iron(III) transport system permease protein
MTKLRSRPASASAPLAEAARWLRSFFILTLLSLSALPFIYLLRRASAISWSDLALLLFREKMLSIFTQTFGLAFVVAIAALLLGLLFSSLLYFLNLKNRSLYLLLATLPLAIPSYVFTYTYIALFPGFRGFWAAALVLTFATMPYVLLASFAGLRRVDPVQIEVARSLGFNRFETFFKIVLPQIRSALGASLLLVILYVFSDFGAVSLLGVDTFTRTIQNLYRASFDRQSAAVIGLILMAIAAAIVLFEERIQKRTVSLRTSVKAPSPDALISHSGARFAVALLLLLYSFFALFIPIYVLISRMVSNFGGIDYPSLLSATGNTIFVATLGALIALLFTLPLAWTISMSNLYRPSRLALATEKMVLITHALPGVVLGLSLVAFSSNFPWLYQSIGLLAFAYALLFMAKALGNTRSSLERISPILKDVSLTMGVTPWQTFKRITLPLAAPGVGVGFLLVLLTAMKELPATLMLRPTGFETLALEIWSQSSLSRFNEAAPYALVLVLLAAIPTFILSRPDRQHEVEARQEWSREMN